MVGKVARDGNIYRAFKDTLGKTQVEGAGRPLEREGGGWALGADRGPVGSGGQGGAFGWGRGGCGQVSPCWPRASGPFYPKGTGPRRQG